ncbi:MAG: PAS domain S-box protein, partial [Hyphomicrobiales bacterium]|nr:PAS domain S-box protein [Hyphomicrobiales bacterium]
MNEPDHGAGLGQEDIEAAFADPAFASLRQSGAPVFVIASDPVRVAYANPAAEALFGANAAAISRRIANAGEPGALRLLALARALPPGAPPRLERLRFFFGPVAETVTALCRRIGRADGASLFAVALLGVRARPDSVVPMAPPATAALAAPSETGAEHIATERARRAARFAWRTDGDHRLISLSPGFDELLSARGEDLVGRSLLDIAREKELDPDGRLAAALGARDTWSGIDVEWPLGDGALRAPVKLGAAPMFDADETFLGFAGFGLVQPERIEHSQSAPAPARAVENVAERPANEAGDVAPDAGSPPPAEAERAEPQAAEETTAAPFEPAIVQDAVELETPAHAQIVSVTDAGAVVYGDADRDIEPVARQATDDSAAFVIDAPDLDEPEEPAAPAPHYGKIVPLRPQQTAPANIGALSATEQSAFEEIGRALGAGAPPAEPAEPRPSRNQRARDLIDLVARFGRSDEPAPTNLRETATPALSAPPAPVASAPPPVETVEPMADMEEARNFGRNARAMLDRLPVGIVVSRFDVPIYVNRTLLDLLDYDDADAFHAGGGMDKLFHGGAPDSGATKIEARDGALMAVDARVQAIEWDDAPATLISFRRAVENGDDARAKALELDLRRRDAETRELRDVLDTATDGVALLDDDGRVLSLNRSAEKLFGYDQKEIAGEKIAILVAPVSQGEIDYYFDGVKSGLIASAASGREIVGRRRNGDVIPLLVTLGRVG